MTKDDAQQQYENIRKRFFAISLIIFIALLTLYSPNKNTSFLPLTSFPCLVILSAIFSSTIYFVSCLFYATFYLPPGIVKVFPPAWIKMRPSYSHNFSDSNDTNRSDTKRDDWYNDVTNPISPIYQITHHDSSSSSRSSSSSNSYSSFRDY